MRFFYHMGSVPDKHIFLVKKVVHTKMYSSGQFIFKVHMLSVGL